MSSELKKTPNQIVNSFICYVDLNDKKDEEFRLVVRFFQATDWWKGGWYFEGFILEPIGQS